MSTVGVPVNQIALHVGGRKMLQGSGQKGANDENYLVDRNFIVSALARYLNDHYKGSKVSNIDTCEGLLPILPRRYIRYY